uniref:Uncharacterized protein n=1 Tax=Myotis myotis TaxID=51298 RepID=A0A7J7YDQ4_MYOMY|nr:hypothetical protein mMyoMyo1_010966 [Myotis myotis]
MSSLPNLRNSSCVSSLPPSKEQQFCEQHVPIQGAAAAHSSLRSSSHTSRPPTSEERQPCTAFTSLRSRATTACTCPMSSSQVSGTSPSEEEQQLMQLTPVQRASASQAAHPRLRSSRLAINLSKSNDH